jgi:predicted aspartyl protease
MTDDKEPIWSQVRIRQPVDDIIQYGPSIEVDVSAIDGGPRIKALAQIDTGAHGTAISTRLALKLDLRQIGAGEIRQPGLAPIVSPYFRVRVTLPIAGDIETDVAGLSSLSLPHDILIGRNVLAAAASPSISLTALLRFISAPPHKDRPCQNPQSPSQTTPNNSSGS